MMTNFGLSRKLISVIFTSTIMAGCANITNGYIPGISQQDFISSEQVAYIDQNADAILYQNPAMLKPDRDNYITAKMFIIDRNYAFYERNIARDDNSTKLFGSLATIGMSTAATVIPLGPTTKILNATITAVQGSEKAIDQDLLLNQAIQSIQKQMRADRAIHAKLIWNRMKACDAMHYPIYIAMSDLETYRRDGTLESAIEGLSKTTSAVETAAVAAKNSSNVSAAPVQANATIAAASQNLSAAVGITPAVMTNAPKTTVCPI